MNIELRDYFAAKALPAIMEDWYKEDLNAGDESIADSISMLAYVVADAMMIARDKK